MLFLNQKKKKNIYIYIYIYSNIPLTRSTITTNYCHTSIFEEGRGEMGEPARQIVEGAGVDANRTTNNLVAA